MTDPLLVMMRDTTKGFLRHSEILNAASWVLQNGVICAVEQSVKKAVVVWF